MVFATCSYTWNCHWVAAAATTIGRQPSSTTIAGDLSVHSLTLTWLLSSSDDGAIDVCNSCCHTWNFHWVDGTMGYQTQIHRDSGNWASLFLSLTRTWPPWSSDWDTVTPQSWCLPSSWWPPSSYWHLPFPYIKEIQWNGQWYIHPSLWIAFHTAAVNNAWTDNCFWCNNHMMIQTAIIVCTRKIFPT